MSSPTKKQRKQKTRNEKRRNGNGGNNGNGAPVVSNETVAKSAKLDADSSMNGRQTASNAAAASSSARADSTVNSHANHVTQGEDEAEMARVYERLRIRALAEEREKVQKKTFTKWVNMQLEKAKSSVNIDDLFYDLRDGRSLLKLLELLTGDSVARPSKGRMRIHCLENVDKVLGLLRDAYDVHLENVGAHDIVDGNARITLGLIWTLILRFQIQGVRAAADEADGEAVVVSVAPRTQSAPRSAPTAAREATDALLLWCQMKTAGYRNVNVRNFKSSWRDGLAFNALIHKHRPDLIDFNELQKSDAEENLENAFAVAEERLNIPRLLDPEDVDCETPDEKSIITYVVTLYHYFSKTRTDTLGVRRAQRLLTDLANVDKQALELDLQTSDLLKWINATCAKLDERVFEGTLAGVRTQMQTFGTYRKEEKPPRFAQKGAIEAHYATLRSRLQLSKSQLHTPIVTALKSKLQDLDAAWKRLNHAEHGRETALRGELLRQERLEQLASKFDRKSSMREQWLIENQQLVSQNPLAADYASMLANSRKHEAIATDISLYFPRIEALEKVVADLRNGNYHDYQRIASRMNSVRKLWDELNGMMALRGDKLRLCCRLQLLIHTMDQLNLHIEELQQRVAGDLGKSVAGVNLLLERNSLLLTEVVALAQRVATCREEIDAEISGGHFFGLSVPEVPGQSKLYVPYPPELFRSRVAQLDSELERLRKMIASRADSLQASKSRWAFVELVNDEMRELLDEVELVFQETHLVVRHTSDAVTLTQMSKRGDELDAAVERKRRRAAELTSRGAPLIDDEAAQNGGADVRAHVDAYRARVEALRVEITQLREECAEKLRVCHFLSEAQELIDELAALERVASDRASLGDRIDVELSRSALGTVRSGVDPLARRFDELCSVGRSKLAERDRDSPVVLDQLAAVRQRLSALDDTTQRWHSVLTDRERFSKTCDELESLEVAISRREATLKRVDVDVAHFDERTPFDELAFYCAKLDELTKNVAELRCGALDSVDRRIGDMRADSSRFANECAERRDEAARRLSELERSAVARREQLTGLFEVVRLAYDLQDATTWLNDRLRIVEEAEKKYEVSGPADLAGLLRQQRALSGVERDLKTVEERVLALAARIDALEPRPDSTAPPVSSELRETLLKRFANVNALWDRLMAAMHERDDRLKDSRELQHFLVNLEEYTSWLSRTRSACENGAEPTSIEAVESLVQQHGELKSELAMHISRFSDELYPFGIRVAKEGLTDHEDPEYVRLRERLEALKGESAQLEVRWGDRQRLLAKRLALFLFAKEVKLVDAALGRVEYQLVRLAQREPITAVECRELLKQLDTLVLTSLEPLDSRQELVRSQAEQLRADWRPTLTPSELEGIEQKLAKFVERRAGQSESVRKVRESLVRRLQYLTMLEQCADLEDLFMEKHSAAHRVATTDMPGEAEVRKCLARLRAIESELQSNEPRLTQITAEVNQFVNELRSLVAAANAAPVPAPAAAPAPAPASASTSKAAPVAEETQSKKGKKAKGKKRKEKERVKPREEEVQSTPTTPENQSPTAPAAAAVTSDPMAVGPAASFADELENRVKAARAAYEEALAECQLRETAVLDANRGALCNASLRQTENWIESLQSQMVASMPLATDTVEAVYAPFNAQMLVPPRRDVIAGPGAADNESRTSICVEDSVTARSAGRSFAEPTRGVSADTASITTGRSSAGVSQRQLEKLILQQENVEVQLRVKLAEVEQFEKQTLSLNQTQTETQTHSEMVVKQTEQRRQLDALSEQLRENRGRLELLKQLKRFSVALDVERGWIEDHEAILRSLLARFADEPNQLVLTNSRGAHQLAELLAKRIDVLHREVVGHRSFVLELAEAIRAYRAENEQAAGETLRSEFEDLTERATAMCSTHAAFQQHVADTISRRVDVWRAYFAYLADLFEVRSAIDDKHLLVDGIPSAPDFNDRRSQSTASGKPETLLSGVPIEPPLPDSDPTDLSHLVPAAPTMSLRHLSTRRRQFEHDMKRLDEIEAELNTMRHDRLEGELGSRRESLLGSVLEHASSDNEYPITVDANLPARRFNDTLGEAHQLAELIASKRALLIEASRHANNECSLLELIEWLYEHIGTASANAVAMSLEHSRCLLEKFDRFRDETIAYANEHVPMKIADCRRMLGQAKNDDENEPDSAASSPDESSKLERRLAAESLSLAAKSLYAAYIDLLSELHSDLVELLATKRQHLEAQIEKFAFITVCSSLSESIVNKIEEIEKFTVCAVEPVDADINLFISENRERIQRSHGQLTRLKSEVQQIGEQVKVMSAKYRQLVPAYGGSPLEILTCEYERLITEWRKLQLLFDNNLHSSDLLGQLAGFLNQAAAFVGWCERTRGEMQDRKDSICSVSDVQTAYSDHVSRVKKYIDAHDEPYRSCLDAGFELIRAGHEQAEMVKNRLLEVADNCFDVRDFWELERARLSLLVDVCSFVENASSAAEWLSTHEAVIADVNFGNTLEEIERLLKTHDLLEKSLSRQRDRFERVKELTRLELDRQKELDIVEAERLERRERFIHDDVFAETDRIERERAARASSSTVPLEVDVVRRSATRDETTASSSALIDGSSGEIHPSRPASIELAAPRTVTPALPTPELLKIWSGTVMRKHLTQAGIRRAPDRAWHTVYCVIEPQSCTLSFHKDAKQSVGKSAKANTVSYFRNEAPVSLRRAIAQQTEYKRRRFVLSLTLETGASYMIQCESEQQASELVRRFNAIAVSHLHGSSALQSAIEQGTGEQAGALPSTAIEMDQSATIPRVAADSGAAVNRRWTFLTLRRKKEKNTQRPVSLQEGTSAEA